MEYDLLLFLVSLCEGNPSVGSGSKPFLPFASDVKASKEFIYASNRNQTHLKFILMDVE